MVPSVVHGVSLSAILHLRILSASALKS
jgi:hypothetical protein